VSVLDFRLRLRLKPKISIHKYFLVSSPSLKYESESKIMSLKIVDFRMMCVPTFLRPCKKGSDCSSALEVGGVGGTELQMPTLAITMVTSEGTVITHSWGREGRSYTHEEIIRCYVWMFCYTYLISCTLKLIVFFLCRYMYCTKVIS